MSVFLRLLAAFCFLQVAARMLVFAVEGGLGHLVWAALLLVCTFVNLRNAREWAE